MFNVVCKTRIYTGLEELDRTVEFDLVIELFPFEWTLGCS